jgi:hypothetical protein
MAMAKELVEERKKKKHEAGMKRVGMGFSAPSSALVSN